MGVRQPAKLRERVRVAAEAVLKRDGSVGPLELLCQMRLLENVHFECWKKGHESFPTLDKWIHGSPEKLQKTYQYFLEWSQEKGLRPVAASYLRASARDAEPLQVTKSGNADEEAFFKTHYAPADLSPARAKKLDEKLNKAPEIVVYHLTGDDTHCSECNSEILHEDLLCLEKGKPLCLACADLDHLEYLPSGDATLTRRARKFSPLSAVVVRFHRRRKRYERQGILVTAEAIAQAEDSCAEDADKRAVEREKARLRREEEDRDFIRKMTELIREQFPGCPAKEAHKIAAHTSLRGSGRVGRSEAGRNLDPRAIELAVIAWIRHQHTPYDSLLMSGHERQSAREMIRDDVAKQKLQWQQHGRNQRSSMARSST